MKAADLQKKSINPITLGFVIPFTGMCLIILFCMIASRRVYTSHVFSMLYSDMYYQYYPFFVDFRRTLLSGESLLHNWHVGLGMDYLSLMAYYVSSPLNLLSVCIPESWMMGYFILLTPLRMGLSGAFFTYFLQKVTGKQDTTAGIFGTFYALCAWVVGYRWNIMWMDTFMLLPLVALGTVQVLRERKYILYTVSLFLSVLGNYYVGLFTCIFVVIICLCYEISRFAGFKKLIVDFLLMLGLSVLAIGMTAFLELPAFMALSGTEAAARDVIGWDERNIATDSSFLALLDAMRKVAGNMSGGLEPNFKDGELPNLYCGIGMNVLAFLFLTCRQVRWRDKICTVLVLVFFNLSFIFKKLDYLWHGTHVPNMIPYRFSFLYSFVVLYMAYRAWELRRRIRPWQVCVSIVPALGLMVANDNFWDLIQLIRSGELSRQWAEATANWRWSYTNLTRLGTFAQDFIFLAYNLVFLILYFVCMLVYCWRPRLRSKTMPELRHAVREGKSRRSMAMTALVMVFCAEQLLNMVSFGVYLFPGSNLRDYPKGGQATYSMVRLMQQREQDNLFYRTETTRYQTLNDGALIGYNGVTCFTSTANKKTTSFMKAMGYYAEPSFNRYVHEQSTPVSNLFLNLKYVIDRDGKIEENPYWEDLHHLENVHLLENNAYLPLGFMTQPELAELNFNHGGDPFAFQDKLLSAATGQTVDAWKLVQHENLSIASRETELRTVTDYGYVYYKGGSEGGSVYYTYDINREGLFCIYQNAPSRNTFTFSHAPAGEDYQTLYSINAVLPAVYSVCYVQPGDRIQVTVSTGANQSSSLTVHGAVLRDDVFQQCYSTLSQSVLELTRFENTLVEGTVSCPEDGLLYTSIPQDGNWQVWVDGEKASITLVGDVMAGVMLEKGTHSVTFRYINPWFNLGSAVSLVCAGVFAVVCWLQLGRPWPKKKRKA